MFRLIFSLSMHIFKPLQHGSEHLQGSSVFQKCAEEWPCSVAMVTDDDDAHSIVYKMYFITHLFLRTITFLLDGLGLRNSKTLHCLVFLLLGFVLVRLLLVLTVRVDQHSAVECVAVSSGTLAGPGNAIHYREGKECR